MKKGVLAFLALMQTVAVWAQSVNLERSQPADSLERSQSAKDPIALEQQPGRVDKARVMDYFQNQEFTEAVEYLSPLVQADSGNVAALGWAGYAYYMTEKGDAAAACYRRVLVVDSNNIGALHYLVLLEQGEHDGGEALGYAQRLLALQPARAVWWRTVAECWRRKNKPDSALVYFDSAYERAPRDVKTVIGLADVLIDKKQNARADTIVDYALTQDSLNISLLKSRVRSAYLAEDFVAATLPGERLVRLKDPSVTSLTWLALSYYNLKQYSECVRICEHMQGLGLELESVYYYEARAYAKMKDYPRSNILLTTALSKAISNTAEWYFDARADNYEAMKEYKNALANSDSGYYLFKDPIALYNCGRICESELHNVPLARQYYQRYLAVAQPKSEQEKKAYAYVRQRWGKKGKAQATRK